MFMKGFPDGSVVNNPPVKEHRGAACPDAVLLLQSLPAGALLSRSVTSPETGGQEGRHCSIAEMRKLEDREQTHIHTS